MQEKERIYRIIFSHEEKTYEIYAKYISEESLIGFIEIEELIFTEPTSLIVDPLEEKLKVEFHGVKRSYIPIHRILRIDEMEKQRATQIKCPALKKDNVHHFPNAFKKPAKE